jgi:eukaryotic-like serine/threonine-protein kinase
MKSLFESIGDYQIVEKLGRGGMADVYLAMNRKSGRRVALKLVERGEGLDAQEVIEAERLGAELQQHISQAEPRVPVIYSFGDLDSYLFIEMEFVEGTDLSSLIGSGMTPGESAAIAMQLCSILRITHGMSLQIGGRELRAIVHGDIKPKNIRIDTQGNVRVLDFGIAKGLSITRRLTSNVFGSVAYSSPERLDTGNIDEMSDLWAVGIVLYEMVEEQLPFEAATNERLETIIRSRNPIRPLSDSCPIALQQIICKALAGSPASRYQSAAQFEADLESFLAGKETLAAQENEQTRRMISAEDIETRRTVAETERPISSTEQVVKPKPESSLDRFYRELRERLFRWRKWILTGCSVVVVFLGTWEVVVAHSASLLRPDIVAGRLDVDSAWAQYQHIRQRSILGLASIQLRTPVRDLLLQNSEHVFNDYRNSDNLKVQVREGDWLRCKRYLQRAVQLDSGDRKSAAMLQYANGQIARINRKSADALNAFQRAADLQPKWPDPYLGLARTYIYYLGDADRGAQALERAQNLGHMFGKRDIAMLAESHRKRGLQSAENAKLVQGTEQEKELLNKAKIDMQEALNSYLRIAPYGDSTAQIPEVQSALEQIQLRLDEIEKPNPLLPWNWFK